MTTALGSSTEIAGVQLCETRMYSAEVLLRGSILLRTQPASSEPLYHVHAFTLASCPRNISHALFGGGGGADVA